MSFRVILLVVSSLVLASQAYNVPRSMVTRHAIQRPGIFSAESQQKQLRRDDLPRHILQMSASSSTSSDMQETSDAAIDEARTYLESLQHMEHVEHDHITTTDRVVVGVSTAAMLVAFVALLSASGPGGWRYYLAGGVCAATSHALATPIDVVKTRKQVDPELLDKSFAAATIQIVNKEGINTLLSGLGPTTFGYLLEGSLKFGIYEVLKPVIGKSLATLTRFTTIAWLQSQLISFVISGALSGVAASIMLCPMEAIRIRMVAEPKFGSKGWIHGGYKMFKNEGVSALTKGLVPMLYKQVPYTISKNVAFDILTRIAYSTMRTSGMAVQGMSRVMIPFVCALVTSVLATISSQPGDVLLSLINAHEGTKRTNDFARDIWKGQWGIKGFFVGTKSRLLHVGLIVTSQLLLYDFVKQMVGIAATGSV